MPSVSVIIPVFNKAPYIAETVASVLNQTYGDFEVLLIDDCSTDESVSIINGIASGKCRLFLSERNSGAAVARNTGISNAAGRFLAFLDADDLWLNCKLTRQIEFMRQNNCGFSYTDYEFFGKGPRKKTNVPARATYRALLKNTFIFTSTVVIDTDVIPKSDCLFPNVDYEDTALWRGILKKHGTGRALKEHLTLYRVTDNSLSSNKIESVKRSWRLYRNAEGFSVVKSLYYTACYVVNAAARRL